VPLAELAKLFHNSEYKVTKYECDMFGKSIARCICYVENSETRYWYFDIKISEIYKVDYRIIKKFFEWHFDIEKLIEKGEAIDINTLENNG